MKISYLAHGKVILIGEHSVVYGYNALALPIKVLHIKTSVEQNSKLWMKTTRYSGPFLSAPEEYNGLKYVVRTMCKRAHLTHPTFKVTYTGQIPIERGLGSSATVALGTSKALNKYLHLNLNEKQIMSITNHAEMINHGKASGIDAATVHSDYLIFFNTKEGAQTIKAKLGAFLLIMDTGQLGSTRQAVKQVQDQVKRSDQARAKLKKLGRLANEAKMNWLIKNAVRLGEIFNEAQNILKSFNLSTERINHLAKIALSNQALGFKLSGSGLGGIVIALCSTKENAEKIATKSKGLISSYWIEAI